MSARILVVDDEKTIRWTLVEYLKSKGYDVIEAGDGKSATRLIESETFNMALLDQRLPDTDGLSLLAKIHERYPSVPVLIITAFSSIDGAVEAMKLGAYDYLTKPFNLDEVRMHVERALEASSLRNRFSAEVQEKKNKFSVDKLIGSSKAMVELKDLIKRIADSQTTTVLLLGESGTGKDIAAHAIHYESDRADKQFMNITCSALTESLLESELFGHEKGAFTDAKTQKAGLFEQANGGTVFLDEIGEMPLTLQSRLLRVLEEKAFKRVGGTKDIHVDVRIIAATNKDLEKQIETKQFREDLYYRLSTVPITIPPLRSRREDIPLLAEYFLQFYQKELNRQFDGFSQKALDKLTNHDWPGNIREFRNVIERTVLLNKSDKIEDEDILIGKGIIGDSPEKDARGISLPSDGCNIFDIEKKLVLEALERTDWNKSKACQLLGLTRDQLRSRIEKYSLTQT